MAAQRNHGRIIPGSWARSLKACWAVLLLASCTVASPEPNRDGLLLWWVLDASGTVSIPVSTPGGQDIHWLDLQGSELPAAEAQIRQWVEPQSMEQPRRLGVLLNGALHHDPLRTVTIWSKEVGSPQGIPLERILRYARRVDPEFTLRAVFSTDAASFRVVADKLDRWFRGSTADHQILLLAEPGSARFEAELQRRNPFRTDAAQAMPPEVLRSGEALVGGDRWEWVASDPGERESVPSAPFERPPSQQPAIPTEASAESIAADWELNFDASGGYVRAPAQELSGREALPTPLTPTPLAVNGFGLDLVQHPEWIPQAPPLESVRGSHGAGPASASVWVLWLLPRNLDAAQPSSLILQLDRGIAGHGRLRTRFGEGRLWVIWETSDAAVASEAAVEVALVQGVWNLLILHFDGGSQTAPRIERPYPATWFEIPEWHPRYGPELESPAVRQRATVPQLILDSVRALGSVSPAQLDGLSRERYARFSISQLSYSDAQDLEKSIRRESAGRNQLADWENLKACFAGDGTGFVEHYGIEFEEGFLVKRAGERRFGEDRHYFFNRFDHQPRQSFLVHDHIEQHLLSLGSWVRLYLKAFCETVHPDEGEWDQVAPRNYP